LFGSRQSPVPSSASEAHQNQGRFPPPASPVLPAPPTPTTSRLCGSPTLAPPSAVGLPCCAVVFPNVPSPLPRCTIRSPVTVGLRSDPAAFPLSWPAQGSPRYGPQSRSTTSRTPFREASNGSVTPAAHSRSCRDYRQLPAQVFHLPVIGTFHGAPKQKLNA